MTHSPMRTWLLGGGLFVVFLCYYYITGGLLPLGEGVDGHVAAPDEKVHRDVASFIVQHRRLPLIPEDEAELLFTKYGATRALRPPFTYLVSAAVVALYPAPDIDARLALRRGSALLGALTVWLTFYGLWVYFGGYQPAVLGAFLIGLLPQFAFIASYLNDDSGAILSGTALLVSMVLLLRRGLSAATAAVFGVAVGLVLLSKQTAWLLLASAGLFALLFIRLPWRQLSGYAAIAASMALLAGGWWLVFNMYHYGVDDPFLFRAIASTAARHSEFPPGVELGYGARGVGYLDLVLGNHDDFLIKTYKSTIGNLDLLRLPMAPLLYVFYLVVLGAGLAYFFVRCVAVSRSIALSGVRGNRSIPGFLFELLLVFAMVFQFYMYLWVNIHNDVQVQGRYLLPVQLAVLLLFVSALRRTWQWSERRLAAYVGDPMSIGVRAVRNGAWAALLVFVVILHADSLLRHVVPYYRPLDLALRIGAFEPVELDQLAIRAVHNVEEFDVANGALRVVAHAADAQLIVTSDICRRLEGEAILRLRLRSDDADEFAVYWDRGDGFAEHRSVKHAYPGGTSELHLVMPGRGCERLRIDPRTNPGSTVIEEMAIAPYRLRHRARR